MNCTHGSCTCETVADDGYCAPTCRLGIGEPGEPCKCGHADCSATTGDASAEA